MTHFGTRKFLAVVTTALVASSLASCTSTKDASPGSVDIGLLIPLTGAYEGPGTDVHDAFDLYVDINGGKLGGRTVNISIGDEGDGPETSLPSAEKLFAKDVDAMVGGGSSANYIAVGPEATKRKIPFIGVGGQPNLEENGLDIDWLWQASYLTTQTGQAMAPYIHEEVDGPVYAIGPDYPGGYLLSNSFTEPFLKMGGKLANPGGKTAWTKWPPTGDFASYLKEAAESDAKAIYASYVGKPAIDFVTQWAKSPAKDIPLYGAYITEGSALQAEGKAAKGVQTVMNYSSDIDNAANRTFVYEWDALYPDRPTNTFSLAGWDAALVLDQAIASIDEDEEVTSTAINEAIGNLGNISSPRGTWQFSEKTHTPIQQWYLRTVDNDGPTLANVVTKSLATLAD